jgi:hypothetical protein
MFALFVDSGCAHDERRWKCGKLRADFRQLMVGVFLFVSVRQSDTETDRSRCDGRGRDRPRNKRGCH